MSILRRDGEPLNCSEIRRVRGSAWVLRHKLIADSAYAYEVRGFLWVFFELSTDLRNMSLHRLSRTVTLITTSPAQELLVTHSATARVKKKLDDP
jgi:hypothetical protein